MEIERRKHVRFSPKINACAALGHDFTKTGSIKDISIDGLAFEYIFDGDKDIEFKPQIDIFLLENGFYLSNLPCTIIYDRPLNTDGINSSFDSTLVTKRCAVQFETITKDQTEQLKFFIQNHTSLPEAL